MKNYLAVFFGKSDAMEAWKALPESERKGREQAGMAAWHKWVADHNGVISEMGSPLSCPDIVSTGFGTGTLEARFIAGGEGRCCGCESAVTRNNAPRIPQQTTITPKTAKRLTTSKMIHVLFEACGVVAGTATGVWNGLPLSVSSAIGFSHGRVPDISLQLRSS